MHRWSRLTVAGTLALALVLAPITALAGGDVSPDGRAEVSFVDGVLDDDGQLWFKVGFYNTWGEKPPSDLFSLFWKLTFTVGDQQAVVGWEIHDGVETFLGDAGTQAFILDNGCLIVATGIYPDGDFSVSTLAEFGSWQDEQATDAVFGSTSMGTSAEFIDTGDPFTVFGGSPIFDLGSGEMVTGSTTTSSTSSTTTTAATTGSTSGSTVDDPGSSLVLDDTGGLSPFWLTVFFILAFGIFYWLIVFQFRWWTPPWAWMPMPGPRYEYRVAGGMFEEIVEQPEDDDSDGDDDVTETEDEEDPDTDTDTRTGTDAPYDPDEDDDTGGGLPPATFEDRKPSPKDCRELRLACEQAKETAARAREDADISRQKAAESASELEAARARVAELEAKVADLDSRDDAPQRYQRLAEAQQDLRDARAGIDEIAAAAQAREAQAEQMHQAATEAEAAAAEACRKAEECEQQLGG
jgi:hypothetical protein